MKVLRIRVLCKFIVVLSISIITIASPYIADVLSVHLKIPQYFTNRSGKAIYLGGYQIFLDLQDNSFNKEFIRNKERTLLWDRHQSFGEK